MTKLTKKLLLILASSLLVLSLALQITVAPVRDVINSASDETSATATASTGDVKVKYRAADETQVIDDYTVSDENVAQYASPDDDDLVTVIILVDGTPMMDFAASQGLSVAEALSSGTGETNLFKLESYRSRAESGLSKYIKEYRYNYSTVFNGFSAVIRYGDLAKVESNQFVKKVILSDTYEVPQSVTENNVDVYETGIYNSSSVSYDGTGTVVAVLDTGTDYTHEVFDMELNAETVAITKDDVAAVAPVLTATSRSAAEGTSISEDDLYLTSKLPYAYDYACNDTNVYPFNSHGTHVAGIIAGKSDKITGVAPGAQIATFKVFGDDDQGAETENILAALNDAVTLGVDAINMSLGTSCGFAREVDDVEVNEIYDAVNDAGICLVVAASNSYSSAYGSRWGNTNLASNPDSGTLGSPASYPASLAVASISGVKTKYFMADGKEIYFAESRLLGKTDPNDFVAGLLGDNSEGEFQYELIPGTGISVNYTGIDVNGKIAVVKRGTTSFEEKVRVAYEKGAVGVIVYNNVSGTITMSVGTKQLIPSCFVTQDLATTLVENGSGTIKLSTSYLAGPFMSDFSSWGVLPNLQLSPDITAHGGEIYSAVAGTDRYDKYSGTSMASPNLAGALILVRQYVKETNPAYTTNAVRDESYSRMMSTATIAKNEYGNPYSPRKQGAGLADISNSINTKAYLTVDGSNKPKLSLGDDPQRTGVYRMTFNVVNTSGTALSYKLNPYVMTETMSSDEKTVAERAYLFTDTANKYSVEAIQGTAYVNGGVLSVGGYGKAAVTVEIALSDADKEYLNTNFKNGMYVEGYIRLESYNADKIDLNIPYLAFYGDWTDAPMLDVTEYQVGESAADDSVLAEDKLLADQYGTLPFAGFPSATAAKGIAYYGMGAFAYIPATGYAVPATLEKHASLTTNKEGNYLFYMINAGLFRSAKKVDMEIRDSSTGELLWSGTDYNARKSYGNGEQVGGSVMIELDISELGLANNSKYTFSMTCYLDWQDENGEYTYGNDNTFSFEFTIDNEAPELTDVSVRETKTGNSKRHFLDLKAYDNHYIQGYSVYTYEGEDEEGQLVGTTSFTDGVIPVNSEYNQDTTFSLDITAYWSTIMQNGGKLYVTFYDYAKNTQSFYITLEQEDDLQITKTRTASDNYSVAINGQLDLTDYITVKANTLDGVSDEDKAYVEGYWHKDLIWESSDASVVEVRDGLVTGLKSGTATITVRTPDSEIPDTPQDGWSDTDYCLKFTITVTAAETTINMTGIEMSADALALERGQTATITAEIKPYNYTGEYELEWLSTGSNVKITEISEDGKTVTVRAMESGSATIRATVKGTRISGVCAVTVKNEFVLYNNVYLRSYNGRGDENGVVEIPDDLGISYIYPSAFFNNDYIKKVIIPEGVIQIMETAFYGCDSLEEVVLPESVESVGEFSFGWCPELKTINLGHVKTIDNRSFINCTSLDNLDLSSCTFISHHAFYGCTALSSLDLSSVGIVGAGAFAFCEGLTELVIPANTSLEYESMFGNYANDGVFGACTGLKTVTIYSNTVGVGAFTYCTSLESVTFMNDVKSIGDMAFLFCEALNNVTYKGTVYEIGQQAFYGCGLTTATLPAGLTVMGLGVYSECENLTAINVSGGARLTNLDLAAFYGAPITSFTVGEGNKYLTAKDGVLYDKEMKKLVAYPWNRAGSSFTVPASVKTVGAGAFSAAENLRTVNLNNVEYIEESAFNSAAVTSITGFNNVRYIGANAFRTSDITNLPVTDNVTYIGDYAFFSCNKIKDTEFKISENLGYLGSFAFAGTTEENGNKFYTGVPFTKVSLAGSNAEMGVAVFYGCTSITEVNLGSLEAVNSYTFYGCTRLQSITVPDTVKAIGSYAFFDCRSLENVTLSENLEMIYPFAFAYTALAEITLPDSLKVIDVAAFTDTKLTAIDLKNVEYIGAYAFSNTLLSTVGSDKVTYIGDYAFSYEPDTDSAAAATLTAATFDNAEYVGEGAFAGESKLVSVSLANALEIGADAFKDCASLTAVSLDKAYSVGDGAFEGATKLADVSLASVEELGSNVFGGTAVTSLSLPETLTAIAEKAFFGAEQLAAVNVATGNNTFLSVDGVLYLENSESFYVLICYPAGKTDKAYTVLDRTIKVSAYAFSENKYLEELTLPVHMQVLGDSAFSGMAALKDLTINAVAAPTLESYSDENGNLYNNFNFGFGEKNSKLTVTVPANNTGYDNRIWKAYVGENVSVSDKIHAALGTLDFIERIMKLPANPTAADEAEIATLVRLYNILNSTQKIFVRGGEYAYNGTDGNVIDSDYYKALLGGTDYYRLLTAAQSKLTSATVARTGIGSSNAAPVTAELDGAVTASENGAALWTTLAALAAFGAAAVAVIVIKRRSR